MYRALLVIKGLIPKGHQKADERRRFTKCLTSISAVALTREPTVVVRLSTDALPPKVRTADERIVENIELGNRFS